MKRCIYGPMLDFFNFLMSDHMPEIWNKFWMPIYQWAGRTCHSRHGDKCWGPAEEKSA